MNQLIGLQRGDKQKSKVVDNGFYGKLIAPLGQAASQAWHSVHSSALTNAAFSFAISMHSVGQMLTHSPHPSHFSESNTGGILNPPFFV
jgi:hypothetical protein